MDKCDFCGLESDISFSLQKDGEPLSACPDCHMDMFDEVDEEWLESREAA